MADNIENQTTENEELPINKDEQIIEEGPEDSVDDFASEEELQNDETIEKESRFKEGQDLTFVNVRFPGNARSFPFLLGSKSFHYGQKVVAMSDRGMTVGYINSFPYLKKFDKSMLPLRTISKVATDEDLQKEKDLIAEEKRAERICVDLIERHKLEMNLTHVEFTQFGKKAVFFFTAPNRVDFRGLVKDLVGQLKMRIELRQISVRDRAAALGAIGPCGLQTCCSSFHKNYGNVTIKMAKNQNLALMPNKINGVCGQIKCCIKYEHELYAEKRKKLPKENSLVQALNGDKGKILKLNLLAEEFEMMTSEGKIRRYAASQFQEGHKLPEDWRMPEQFENNIINETKELIGGKAKPEADSEEHHHDERSDEIQTSSTEENTFEESEEPKEQERAETTDHVDTQAKTQLQEDNRPAHQDHRPRQHHNNQRRHHQNNSGPSSSNRRPNQGNAQHGAGPGKPHGQQSGNRPHHNNRPRPQGGRPQQRNPQQGSQGNGNQGGGKPQG